MTARLSEAGRISGKRAVAGMTLAAAATALVLTTGFPAENVLGGGSAALAELVARSPGARVGVDKEADLARGFMVEDGLTVIGKGQKVEG